MAKCLEVCGRFLNLRDDPTRFAAQSIQYVDRNNLTCNLDVVGGSLYLQLPLTCLVKADAVLSIEAGCIHVDSFTMQASRKCCIM